MISGYWWSSTKDDVEYAEIMLDTGSEEHVCGPLLPPIETLERPQSVMRDCPATDQQLWHEHCGHEAGWYGARGKLSRCFASRYCYDKTFVSVGKIIDTPDADGKRWKVLGSKACTRASDTKTW